MDMSEDFDFENRMMTPSYTRDDNDTETSLRPKKLEDYIGQDKAKENLKIYIRKIKFRDYIFLIGRLMRILMQIILPWAERTEPNATKIKKEMYTRKPSQTGIIHTDMCTISLTTFL